MDFRRANVFARLVTLRRARFRTLLACALLIGARLDSIHAADPSDLYLNAYFQVQSAEKAERGGDRNGALAQYQSALELLDQIRKADADWRPDLVNFRTTYCRNKIATLRSGGASARPPAPTPPAEPPTPPAPPKPEPRVESKPTPPAPKPESRPDAKPAAPKDPARTTNSASTTPVVSPEGAPRKGTPEKKPTSTKVTIVPEAAATPASKGTEPELPEGGPASAPAPAVSGGDGAPDANPVDSVRRMQQRIDELAAENKRLRRDLSAANTQIEALGNEGGLDKSVAAMRSQLAGAKEQLDLARMQIDSYERSNADLREKLKEAQNAVNLSKARTLTPAPASTALQSENDVLRGIVKRQLQSEQKRDAAKRALLAEVRQLQVGGDTVPRLIEQATAPGATLTPTELAVINADAGKTGPAADPIAGALDAVTASNLAVVASSLPGAPDERLKVPPVMKSIAQDAATYFQQRDYARAAEKYREILQQFPDNVYCLANYGVVLFQQGKLKEAEEVLKRASQLAPQDAFSLSNLGITYYQMQRYDEAVAALTRASTIKPNDAQVHNYLGISCSRKGWNTTAEQELLKAVEINANYADAHFNLAVIYATQKPPARELARKHYQAATLLGIPKDPELEQLMGLVPTGAPATTPTNPPPAGRTPATPAPPGQG